jgi:hypothetical protein
VPEGATGEEERGSTRATGGGSVRRRRCGERLTNHGACTTIRSGDISRSLQTLAEPPYSSVLCFIILRILGREFTVGFPAVQNFVYPMSASCS